MTGDRIPVNTKMIERMCRFMLLTVCLLGAVAIDGFGLARFRQNRRHVVPAARRSALLASTRLVESSPSDDAPVVPNLPKWDPTNWTPKRIWNKPLFRSAVILGALGFAGLSTNAPLTKLSSRAGANIHLLSFATWFGTMAYTTFVAGITMYKNLPRQTFGKLQSKLFPKYFNLCSIAIVLQIVSLPSLSSLADRAMAPLGTALAMTLFNQFYLEPQSTKIMFDRYEMEDDPLSKESDEYKKLASQFGKFHGMSSLTNLVALIAAVVHGSTLASALVV